MIAGRKARTRNEKSIVALLHLLEQVITNPRDFISDAKLRSALRRQERLALYSNAAHGVEETSMSTMKRLSEKVIDGGFEHLNALRLAAGQGVETEAREAEKGRKRTKARLENDLKDAGVDRVKGLVDLWQVTAAFHQALSAGRLVAMRSRNPAMVALWETQEENILAMFDLAKRPVVERGSDAETWLTKLRQI